MQASCRNIRSLERGRVGAQTAVLRSVARRIPLCSSPATVRCAALGPGGGKSPEDIFKKLAQEAGRHVHHLLDCLTPKQEYDFADVTLIFVSTLVFMWLAAGLYRVYAFTYYLAAGTP